MECLGALQMVLWHESPKSSNQEISQATDPKYWPPFASWVQGGPKTGWRWSRGSNVVTGPLGLVAGEPDRHWGWLLCLLRVHLAGSC